MAQSLAVKWRPKTLKEMVGQKTAISILSQTFEQDDVPNGFLITGDTGLGKSTSAYIIARTLNCENRNGCGTCISCKQFDTNMDGHQNFTEVDAASESGIDDIRKLIELSRYAPANGGYRVILVDEVHNLSPKAMQGLLKSIESPAGNTIWILATTNPEKLPRAISMGRLVTLHLKPVETKELAKRLFYIAKKEKCPIEGKLAMKIANYSGGMVRHSISMLERVIKQVKSKKNIDVVKALEDSFFETNDKQSIDTAIGILIGLYESKPGIVIKFIGEITDSFGTATRLENMNGFVMFSIAKITDKTVHNPFYATPDNRSLLDAIMPDLMDKDKGKVNRQAYFRKSIELAGRIKQLKSDITTISGANSTSLIVSNLLS